MLSDLFRVHNCRGASALVFQWAPFQSSLSILPQPSYRDDSLNQVLMAMQKNVLVVLNDQM